MRKSILCLAILAVGCAIAGAQAIRVTAHNGATDPFGKYFDAAKKHVVIGRVSGIAKAAPTPDEAQHVSILVDLPGTRQSTEVELGPDWYVDEQEAKLNVGDDVEVTGSDASFNGHPLVLASQVRVNGRGGPVLALRRLSGRAYWLPEKAPKKDKPKDDPAPKAAEPEKSPAKPPQIDQPPYVSQPAVLRLGGNMQVIDDGMGFGPFGNGFYQPAPFINVVSGFFPFTLRPF